MCGRFVRTATPQDLADLFDLAELPAVEPRYNIAPSQAVLAVRQTPEHRSRQLVALRWGLIPHWADDPKIGYCLINARAETAAVSAVITPPRFLRGPVGTPPSLLDLGLEFLQFGQEPRQFVRLRAARISTGVVFAEMVTSFLTPLGVPFRPAHQSHQDGQIRRVQHTAWADTDRPGPTRPTEPHSAQPLGGR